MPFLGSQPAETALTGGQIADDVIDSNHYANGSIDTAHIADDQITLAKIASGTDGELITWDASGNPAVVAAGTSGHYLKSQGAGSVPVFAEVSGGDTWTYHSEASVSSGTTTTFSSFAASTRRIWISFEGIDTDGDCDLTVCLGDSGGVETSGYAQRGFGDGSNMGAATDGFVITGNTGQFDTNQILYGFCNLVKMQSGSELWAAYSVVVMDHDSNDAASHRVIMAGTKTLTGALTQVRVNADGLGDYTGGKINCHGES